MVTGGLRNGVRLVGGREVGLDANENSEDAAEL